MASTRRGIYGLGRSEASSGGGPPLAKRRGPPSGFVVSAKLDPGFETNAFDAAQARLSLEAALRWRRPGQGIERPLRLPGGVRCGARPDLD